MVFKPFNVIKKVLNYNLIGFIAKKGHTNFTFNTGFTTTKL